MKKFIFCLRFVFFIKLYKHKDRELLEKVRGKLLPYKANGVYQSNGPLTFLIFLSGLTGLTVKIGRIIRSLARNRREEGSLLYHFFHGAASLDDRIRRQRRSKEEGLFLRQQERRCRSEGGLF